MRWGNGFLWLLWILGTIGLVGYLGLTLRGDDRSVFLPGKTSDGHHQIELVCEACHAESFASLEAMQKACERCHLQQLKAAKDEHPKSKFTDPRNADRVAMLDARYCTTCHVEHRAEISRPMGLTMPEDYCYLCHDDIAEERPSHTGMAFDSCASAGCHNFHDNQALYEDFLGKHLKEPDTLDRPAMAQTPNLSEVAELIGTYPIAEHPIKVLKLEERDAPASIRVNADLLQEWVSTAHATNGVNCKACHQADGAWTDHPPSSACERCHEQELQGFLLGKHGMRLDRENLKRDLSPMSPATARLAMKGDAQNKSLSCTSCHGSHRFDTAKAAVDACLQCHDDEHSRNFVGSPHERLWLKERAGQIERGRGVSCATCHMPRTEREYFFGEIVQILTQHNQSENLRPNEKMLRPVCMDCHGLGFSIDALADPELITANFRGRPARRIASIDMAEKRAKQEAERKRRRKASSN